MLVRNHIIRKMLMKLKWICLFFFFFLRWKIFTVVIALHWVYLAIWSRPASVKRHRPHPNRFKVCETLASISLNHVFFFLFSQFFNDRVWFLSFFFTWSRGRYSSQFAIRHIQRYRSDSLALRHDAWIEESILIWFTYNLADLVSVAINQTIIIFVYVFIIFNRSRSGRV